MRSLIFCTVLAGLAAGPFGLVGAEAHAMRGEGAARMFGNAAMRIARPAALPVQGAGSGLTASYFANGTLAGAPSVRRIDAAIDFNWGTGAPAEGLPTDNFSVRWEGLLAAPSTGRYRFLARTEDEVRVWVNGKQMLDTWNGRKPSAGEGYVELAAGEKTSIRIEYADSEGDARLQLQWVPPGQAAQVIGTSYLYPLGSPTTPDPVNPAAAVAAAPVAKPQPTPVKKPAAAKPAPKTAAAKPAETKPVAKAAPKPEAPKAEAKPKQSKADAKAAETAAALPAGVYILTSRAGNKPLEVIEPGRPNRRAYSEAGAGGPTVEGRSTAPQWRIESLGNGFYRIGVQGSNKVLEVLGSATSNGTPMSLWTYYSGNNQLWRIEPAEGSYYKLIAKHSNKALTAKDSIEGGLQQWRYSARVDQQWKLEAVATEDEVASVAAAAPADLKGTGSYNMSIYPNPSNGVVQLRYSLPEEIPMGWVLYNQNGAPVRVSDYRRKNAGAHHQTLDFTGLPAGDYNLRMTVGANTTRVQLQLRKPSAGEAATADEASASGAKQP